jgi:hypothetical protein
VSPARSASAARSASSFLGGSAGFSSSGPYVIPPPVAVPRAADTTEGMVAWWIRRPGDRAGRELVDRVLAELVESGLVVRRTLPDGTPLFSAAPRVR